MHSFKFGLCFSKEITILFSISFFLVFRFTYSPSTGLLTQRHTNDKLSTTFSYDERGNLRERLGPTGITVPGRVASRKPGRIDPDSGLVRLDFSDKPGTPGQQQCLSGKLRFIDQVVPSRFGRDRVLKVKRKHLRFE